MEETFKDRQDRENKKCWERWIACGFSSEEDMPVNKYGGLSQYYGCIAR